MLRHIRQVARDVSYPYSISVLTSYKKPPKKPAATTAATPTAEGEASDDVPPPTPSTPKNTASHLIKGTAPQLPNVQPQPQMPAQNNVPNMAMAQNNNNTMLPFGGLGEGMVREASWFRTSQSANLNRGI